MPFAKLSTARPTRGPAFVVGDFSGAYGLARGAVYDSQLVQSRHSEVIVVDIGPYLAKRIPIQSVITQSVENVYFFSQPDTYGVAFSLFDPASLKQSYRTARWLWETPVFPEDWRFTENLIHEIWTPSEYCAGTFRSGLDLPVTCVPHKIAPPAPAQIDARRKLGIAPDTFMGLAIMDISTCPQRKNPWAHIKAWKQAFDADYKAVLIMKIRVSRRTACVLAELNDLIGSNTNVKILTDELTNLEISALQHSCDVYLSLHRAEGYGLTIHEALLCGKPVLATHWSANAEYGSNFSNYIAISHKLIPYRDWTGHYFETAFSWADPDVAHAAKELRRIRTAWRKAN